MCRVFFCFFKNLFYLFIYFWLCWVFVAARGLSLVVVSGGYSSLRCAGFSLQQLLSLWSMGSRHVGFSSCSTRAQQLWLTGSRAQAQQLWCSGLVAPGMWDLPGPGIEPMSPELAGGFLTTAPPRKSLFFIFNFYLGEVRTLNMRSTFLNFEVHSTLLLTISTMFSS